MTYGRTLLALVLVGVTGLIGWRVLRPASLSATGTVPAPVDVAPGPTGRMSVIPLLVEGQFRVYVSRRQVRADGPVAANTARTPFWSLRRWPQSVSGVVAVGTVVVTRWSDGAVIALDGLTGRTLWRASGFSGSFSIPRDVLWSPPDMFAAAAARVVLLRSGGQVTALAAATGATVWSRACAGPAFATDSDLACGDRLLSASTGAVVATGTFTGVECAVGCLGARDVSGRVWRAGRPIAYAPPSGFVLGSAGGVSYVLTPDRHLVARDETTGTVRGDFVLGYPHDRTDWTPAGWQLADGYLAIDRGPTFTRDQVLLAKLP
ncbi:hypothetical protein [Actinoplanes sp. NPDC049265]|uniref:hypothetical protein n=1 Tax=Actinoplanes sp. NPDC049265 TaxID=3363902 RepID=UPI00371F8DD5